MHVIAIYLPQFHPIRENDEWWGKGFTEWTNVAKAKPLFKGHCQPKIPADLGFYDLRLSEAREAQAKLASEYGITGFCYYHYWFNGRRLLERPFNEVLKSTQPDFPFCLCWANETWRGVWHGAPKAVLVEQTYGGENDIINHFNELIKAFSDKRYIKINNKPVFFIYKPWDIDELPKFIETWNSMAIKEGLSGIHFVAMRHPSENEYLYDKFYNAYAISNLPNRNRWISKDMKLSGKAKASWCRLYQKILNRPTIYDYGTEIPSCLNSLVKDKVNYPIVVPNWDNTPRCGVDGFVLNNSSPLLFKKQLEHAINYIGNNSNENRMVIIKSWNEWAEGNYLEPDTVFGKQYLEIIKETISLYNR